MTLVEYINVLIDPCMAAFCCIAAVYTIRTKSKDPRSKKMLIGTLVSGALLNIADTCTYYFNGNETTLGHVMTRGSNFVLFAIMFFLLAFESGYILRRSEIRGRSQMRQLMSVAFIIAFVGIAAVILSPFFGLFYRFNAHNQVMMGDYYRVYLILIYANIVIQFLYIIINRKAFSKREFRSLIFCILPFIMVIFQYLVLPVEFNLYNFAISASILIIFIEYKRESSDTTMMLEDMKLSNVNIDMAIKSLNKFLQKLGTEKRNRIRITISFEEALLNFQERFGEEECFDLFALVSFGRPQIRLEVAGEIYNPLGASENKTSGWAGTVLTTIGLNPVYSYTGSTNVVKLSLERIQINAAIKLIICLFIGLVAGYIGMNSLSAADQSYLVDHVLEPVYGMLSNLLFTVSGPIMFFMVASAILETAGLSEQGGNGRTVVGRYVFYSFLLGMLPLVVSGFMTEILKEGALGRSEIGVLIKGIINVIPSNPIDPFKNVDTPTLICMGIVIGLAIAVQGTKTKDMANLVHQGNMIGMKLCEWIGSIIPYFAIVIVAMIYMDNHHSHIRDFLILFPVLLCAVVLTMIGMAIVLLIVSRKGKVSPASLVRKCRPSFIVALRSGSLDDSYGLSEQCCVRGFGIEKQFVTSAFPLGLILYMPANVIGTFLFIAYAAVSCDITISPLWLILSVFLAVVLFAATPPIPGANFLSYIVMISMFGIDTHFLMMSFIFEILYGTFASPANQFFVQMEMILQSKKIGLIKEEVLRKE